MKILIVDDSSDDRRLLKYIVEKKGHEAIEAADGLEGLRMAKIHGPDLIISDALMPLMDGFQFLRSVREDMNLSSTPFIFYSATYRGSEDARLAISLGADGFIIKPKEPAELWEEVELIVSEERKEKVITAQLIEGDPEYLKKYSQVVASKLEEKVKELEEALAERKRTEEALRESEAFVKKILKSVDEGFIVLDREFRIVSANRAFFSYVDAKEQQVLGRTCYEISHHADRPCFEAGGTCAVKRTFETGEPQTESHTHIRGDGSRYYVEIKSYPMTDSAGNVMSAIETIRDVTEKKKLEEQLFHSQKMEALGTLAGGVAHDFNNILTAISGYGSLMEMSMSKDDPHVPYLREILSASERAARLTQSLLIFSRKEVAEPKPLDINDLVNGMEKMLLRVIGEDIESRIILCPGVLAVMGDCGQLEQVLMNLLTNARDAMPEGGTFTIETRLFEIDEEFIHLQGFGNPGKYALIIASDTGKGMNAQTRERIFEPFFTTKESGKGTGLGLAIVYGIVNQHNGFITCSSEPEKGTTFTVYLPLIREAFPPPEVADTSAVRGGSETILIADDDPDIRKMTREVLEMYGYCVIEAVDGVDTVDKYMENRDRIALALLDVVMPRKSGKDAFEEIRAVSPGMKVLFCSGYSGDVLQRKKIIDEGLEMLQKPVKLRELLWKIREILDMKAEA